VAKRLAVLTPAASLPWKLAVMVRLTPVPCHQAAAVGAQVGAGRVTLHAWALDASKIKEANHFVGTSQRARNSLATGKIAKSACWCSSGGQTKQKAHFLLANMGPCICHRRPTPDLTTWAQVTVTSTVSGTMSGWVLRKAA
jgi:hypothetical protein